MHTKETAHLSLTALNYGVTIFKSDASYPQPPFSKASETPNVLQSLTLDQPLLIS